MPSTKNNQGPPTTTTTTTTSTTTVYGHPSAAFLEDPPDLLN